MNIKVPDFLTIDNNPVTGLRVLNSLENKYIKSDILKSNLILDILKNCADWIDEQRLFDEMSKSFDLEKEYFENLLNKMIENGLLVSNEYKRYKDIESNSTHWIKYNWNDALKFHIHTNNLHKNDYSSKQGYIDDLEAMKSKMKEDKNPSNYKEYDFIQDISLNNEQKANHKNLDNTFRDFVGIDKYKSEISFSDFSKLLYLSFGQTGIKTDPVTGEHIAKTSPSGGARHPLETYVFIENITGLERGIYHYSIKNHSLKLLKQGEFLSTIKKDIICGNEKCKFNIKACFIHSLIFERSMHRYREPRSYRAVNYDIGHIMQTTALTCSYLNINSYRGYSMNERVIENLIGLDGIYESACTFTIIG